MLKDLLRPLDVSSGSMMPSVGNDRSADFRDSYYRIMETVESGTKFTPLDHYADGSAAMYIADLKDRIDIVSNFVRNKRRDSRTNGIFPTYYIDLIVPKAGRLGQEALGLQALSMQNVSCPLRVEYGARPFEDGVLIIEDSNKSALNGTGLFGKVPKITFNKVLNIGYTTNCHNLSHLARLHKQNLVCDLTMQLYMNPENMKIKKIGNGYYCVFASTEERCQKVEKLCIPQLSVPLLVSSGVKIDNNISIGVQDIVVASADARRKLKTFVKHAGVKFWDLTQRQNSII